MLKKTYKKLLSASKTPPYLQPIFIINKEIQRKESIKLIRVQVQKYMKWSNHVNFSTAKTRSKIYFLKQLIKTKVNETGMITFYTNIVRPHMGHCR